MIPIECAAHAELPTRYGDFRVLAYQDAEGREYGVLVRGEVAKQSRVPVRLHSECFTGDVMGSMRCDCRDQLELALRHVGQSDLGVIIYLPQEGRGIGLANKIKAYALQDAGMDTVQANHALGFPDDLRTYEAAAAILLHLGVQNICLLSNNPRKQIGLAEGGVEVAALIPLKAAPNMHNAFYLETKKEKSGHLL